MSFDVPEFPVIEMKMLNKKKYYPLTLVSTLATRSLVYPFILIKTRLQIQKGHSVYRGTFDAFLKIAVNEGKAGLYRGFWVSCLQVVPTMAYISSYEWTRHYLSEHFGIQDKSYLSFFGGGFACMIGQTIGVPLDIVTQHLMLLGGRSSSKGQEKLSQLQHIHLTEAESKSKFGSVQAIIRAVHKEYGLIGFYKGYFVSIAFFVPNSALWWYFYDHYCVLVSSFAPAYIPRLAIQVIAAPLSGVTSAVLTNPVDVIRARIQVEGTFFAETVRMLWKEESLWMITKGLSARLVQSIPLSFLSALSYETVKRWSVLDEYKDQVKW